MLPPNFNGEWEDEYLIFSASLVRNGLFTKWGTPNIGKSLHAGQPKRKINSYFKQGSYWLTYQYI